jgi:hypothetical protein
MPMTVQAILKHSKIKKYEFPLAIKMFTFSTLCLILLRTGKLYPWCNEERKVVEVVNTAYKGLFLKFAFRYISESHDIKTINNLSQEIEAETHRLGLPASVDEFTVLSDEEGKTVMIDAARLAQ